MVGPEQIRAARALLGWSQGELATRAGVVRRSIYAAENASAPVAEDTLSALVSALEAAGIVFLTRRGKVGVVGPKTSE